MSNSNRKNERAQGPKAPSLNNIPSELKSRRQWVLWKYVKRKGILTKVPYTVDGKMAKANDPSSWSTFLEVVKAYRNGGYSGIGFVFADDDPYFGIDLDACRDPETGELTEWSQEIVDQFATYCEVSPSGYGVKLVARGKIPENARHVKKLKGVPTFGTKEPEIAIYDHGRFWCMTGHQWMSGLNGCEPRQPQLESLLARLFSPKTAPRPAGARTRPLVSEFERLLSQCESASKGARSEHDFALCLHAIRAGMDLETVWMRVQNIGKFSERGHQYFDLTWSRALAEVANSRAERPKIVISPDEPVVVDQAIEALSSDPTVFKRGNSLVTVVRDETQASGIIRSPNSPRIALLPQPTLRERIAGSAVWIRANGSGGVNVEKPVHPPEWVVNAVAARGCWSSIRPIEGVVETPVLRPDGTIVDQPGYDLTTGLLYEPTLDFSMIPESPTLEDARNGLQALVEVVEDFPYATASHRSGWIAGVMTPFARFAFQGPAPMFGIESNTRGAGKSLLADVTGTIVVGGPMPRMVNPESDAEMRKRITTLAVEGDRMVLVDNVGSPLGSASLDAALTATSWKDRLLGTNRSTATLPLSATWYATGNNIVFNGDTIRRVVSIRLTSDLEKPEERSGFSHPDLLAWVRQERGRLVCAALTVLRAYCLAGRPDQQLQPWGSYEGWSSLVRQAIVWAGQPDPAAARMDLAAHSDNDAAVLRALHIQWKEIAGEEGMTVSEVFGRLQENQSASNKGTEPLKWLELRAAIAEFSGRPLTSLPGPRSFGMRLHHARGRVIGGQRFVDYDRNGTKVWRVESLDRGTKGTSGTILQTAAGPPGHAVNPINARNSPGSPVSTQSHIAEVNDNATCPRWEDCLEPLGL